MPFVKPPVCFVCGKVHSCDTKDTVQLVAHAIKGDTGYRTVNVCKTHPHNNFLAAPADAQD